MNNYPAPPIFLHKTLDESGRPTYHVVDGKQRLSTIIDFFEGRIRIPDDFAEYALQKKNWSDLERESKEKFWNYTLSVEMLPEVTDAFVRNIFDRINRNSRNLKPQEMRHAKYEGWFITAVENEAEKPFWKQHGMSTPARTKRMQDVQFISELFGVILKKQLSGFDQDALDDLYAEYDDASEDLTLFNEDDFNEEVDAVETFIQKIGGMEPDLQRVFKVQAHFYSLWGLLVLKKGSGLSAEEFATRYLEFMTAATAAIETPSDDQNVNLYAQSSRGASTDLMPRLNRQKALSSAIYGD